MGGVGGHRHVQGTIVEDTVRGGSEMVLDVSGSLDGSGELSLVHVKLVEHQRQGLSECVGHHTQSAAVGHSKDEVLDTMRSGDLTKGLETGDEGLTSVETESLGLELLVEKVLKELSLGEVLEDGDLLLLGKVDGLALNLLTDPGLLFRVVDVHVLDTNVGAIALLEDGHDFTQGAHRLASRKLITDVEGTIEIGLRETIRRHVELFEDSGRDGAVLGAVEVEGVEGGLKVSRHTVSADQEEDLE
mmetsp:Transcript_38696/g.64302  ORF Transcript_38696/g.64302 Transcript_38696/m.64302 type:complete len:245 (+) Transcript_38696:2029-2763(+)